MMASSSAPKPLRFDGRVVIVTGAGGGMGREHALLLGRLGAAVVINDVNAEAAAAVADAIINNNKMGGSTAAAVVVAGSIAERAVAAELVRTAVDRWGRVDAVVHNAGIDFKVPFEDLSAAAMERMLGVHVWGGWGLVQEAWPHMKRAGRGSVLLVSSTAIYGMAENAAYATAKGGLLGLGRALAIEGQPLGIRVNCLGPYAFTTMARDMCEGQVELSAWMDKNLPVHLTSPVVAWLVHEDCEASGEFITTYGGRFGRMFMSETRGARFLGGARGKEEEYTPDMVRDHWAEAVEMKDSLVVKSLSHAMESLLLAEPQPFSQTT